MSGKQATPTCPADAAGIERAAAILRGGGLVAIPTETVYGLAARADDARAVARIYAAKQRPGFNPLIVHVADIEEAGRLTDLSARVADWEGTGAGRNLREFARTCWPGPTTLVVPRRADAGLAPAVTAGLDTVAIRVPRHRIARQVLRLAGLPLAAPSANRSGFASPTSAAHVLETLDGRIDLVLDGGPSEEGVESTILKLRADGRWEQLRAGPADTSVWHESSFDRRPRDPGAVIEAPGQLVSHYSPGKPVRLDVLEPADGEFMIGFGPVEGDVTLSASGDLREAASRLYACLHDAARSGRERVAVAPVPATGIGIAINDRLRRAAA